MTGGRPYRLGAIAYTNVAPLMRALEPGLGLELTAGVPTEANRALLAGEVDLANVSAYEFLRHARELRALPDFSVSVLGSVYSVNLFHAVPWPELDGARVAVTTHSATSVRLLETLLRLDGLSARLEPEDGRLEELLARYPAVLHIGDLALAEWYRLCGPVTETTQMFRLPSRGRLADGRAVEVTDLAASWYARTGLPFVFAVWASRRDEPPPPEVVAALRRARRWGVGHLAEVAAAEAARLGLPERIVQHYLWNFRYHLEAPDRAGLERFAELAVPDAAGSLEYWDA